MPNNELLAAFIREVGAKKSVLARKIGVTRQDIYTYLTPEKFPRHRLSDEERRRIDEYVHTTVRKVAA